MIYAKLLDDTIFAFCELEVKLVIRLEVRLSQSIRDTLPFDGKLYISRAKQSIVFVHFST